MDAFDADTLIYAAVRAHPLGRRVATLFPTGPCSPDDPPAGVGSVLLLPEVLSKAIREQRTAERDRLEDLLSRLELLPVDEPTASMATSLSARYRLRAVDAVHLATAIRAGADRFITNNRRAFTPEISEIDVTYLDALAEV